MKLSTIFSALTISLGMATAASACEPSYLRQHVTAEDRLNSRGAPLSDPAAFLQQDRYWVHAKGRLDAMDMRDSITTTKEARAWYGTAVREQIDPDAQYIMMQGDFVAVVSYDVCSFINEQGERDRSAFINTVDVMAYENGAYQMSFRYVDAARASQYTGLDEYQADPKATALYQDYAARNGIAVEPQFAAIGFVPNAEAYVMQMGPCGQATCPFVVTDFYGNALGQFDAEFGYTYAEVANMKMLVTRGGELLHQF